MFINWRQFSKTRFYSIILLKYVGSHQSDQLLFLLFFLLWFKVFVSGGYINIYIHFNIVKHFPETNFVNFKNNYTNHVASFLLASQVLMISFIYNPNFAPNGKTIKGGWRFIPE